VGRYPSARLVVTEDQGAAVAAALGDARLVVLRNHGIAAVDTTVAGAVVLAVSFERSLRTQLLAARFGPLVPIPDEEVRAMAEDFERTRETRVATAWAYLLRQAGLAECDDAG
jgi:L-fuculose-phosphate aldolase